MRKHLPILILSMFLLLFSNNAAMASEAEWQIIWQDDGSLQEKVTVYGQVMPNSYNGWQMDIAGEPVIFTRTIKNWGEYNRLQDKLPLKVEEKNYVFCTISKLTPANQLPAGTLYEGLSGIDRMNLKISVPGMIMDSSVEPGDQKIVTWPINNPGHSFNKGFSLKAITLDGLMLGITILTLGVFCLFIFFLGRMRRVNRLIEETYSLDNVVIEDDEIEAGESEEDNS